MSDIETDEAVDFDEDELTMLRELFRDEARENLETVSVLALAAEQDAPSADELAEMMRVTHTLKGSAGTVGLTEFVELSHLLETGLSRIRDKSILWSASAGEQLVEIVDGLLAIVDASARRGVPPVATDALRKLIRNFPGPSAITSDGVPNDQGYDPSTRSVAPGLYPTDTTSSIERGSLLRVEAARVDELMSSAGELLFDRTRIERRVQYLRTLARDVDASRSSLREVLAGLSASDGTAQKLSPIEGRLATQATQLGQMSSALLDEVEALRRTIGEIQRGLTRIRMQTARNLFLHLARAARAVSRTVGSRVELCTSGEDTEFDKSVAEQLVDPLIQLLRNAIVHGIESPAERVLAGKLATGTISLSARQESGLLVIEFSDDGRGIDTQHLRDRFVTTGRWSRARAQLASDEDLLHALFDPGVSSRDDADELSGRGIGLDLVREGIARLGGEVRLTSTLGLGTTFTLRLPLSMSVTDAMLFKVGGQVYALPNVHVLETTHVEAHATAGVYRGQPVPLVRLERLLSDEESTNLRKPAVVVDYAGKTFVCSLDKLVGTREIVIKPLSPLLAPLALYAGATISASGKVQLILDSAQLARRAYPGSPDLELDTSRMAGPSGPQGRVLIVDDSRAIREAMSTIMSRDGWIVDVAEHGARALIMAQQTTYDLVVTDLEMPEMSGFELIEQLRALPTMATLLIVVITSRATPENRRRALDLGVRALVAKPVTRRKLAEALP